MVTLADETTEDEAEDLIDLTTAKQKRQWTVDSTSQHANHRLQHSPKVTFFDPGKTSATRGEEKNDDETDMSFLTPMHPRVSCMDLVVLFSFFSGPLVSLNLSAQRNFFFTSKGVQNSTATAGAFSFRPS